MLLAVVANTADAAADRSLAFVVLAEVLRIGQHGLEELQGHNFHLHLLVWVVGQRCLVGNLVDAAHAQVLYHLQMLQVLLAEGHPEACTADGGIVDDQRLNLLVVQQIAVARADVGVGQVLVNLQRLGLHPLAVFPVEALLGDLADVDFRVEVGGESLVVVAGITVYDVEILNLLEVVLGGIGCEDAGHARVEAASQNGCQTGFLEALSVSPLP